MLIIKDMNVFYTAYTKPQVKQTNKQVQLLEKSQIKGKSLY